MRCVTDTNFWIDLYEGSLIGRAFALDDEWLATDLVLHEVNMEGRPAVATLFSDGFNSAGQCFER
jgi:hypothetical protein